MSGTRTTSAPAVLDDLSAMFERYGARLHRYCASRVGLTAAEAPISRCRRT